MKPSAFTPFLAGFNPISSYFLGLEMLKLGLEAQAVIAMRTAGMMGLWATRPQEMTRMWREKPEAATAAWFAAMRSALAGATPEAVTRAAIAPVSKRTGANVRRLARLGPPSLCG